MGRRGNPVRKAWEDKYRTPTSAELMAGLQPPHDQYCRTAREGLSQLAGERISWLGIPWRWSMVYAIANTSRPLAYLVPQPAKPLMVLPLGPEVSGFILEQKLSKPARDGILHAPLVGDVRWTQWELVSKAQVEELIGLAKLVRDGRMAAVPTR